MSDASDAFVWSAERLRSATDAADIALWSWNVDTDEVALDERGYALWGVRAALRPDLQRSVEADPPG